MDLETRFAGEVRVSGRTLAGIAVPFNVPANIGPFTETVMPGATRASLGRDDIRALADHDMRALLGRTGSGTLRLTETAAGLEYSLSLPDTSPGRDLLELARRGDLSGVSIGFTADRESWPTPTTRTLHAISLREISVITSGDPAYAGTTLAVRHRAVLGDRAQLRRAMLAVL
jgi:uncharacterized protein